MSDEVPNEGLKDALIDWTFHQGVSTVLLLILATFIGYRELYLVPAANAAVDASMVALGEKHRRAVEVLMQHHAAEQKEARDDCIAERTRMREDLREMIRELRGQKP